MPRPYSERRGEASMIALWALAAMAADIEFPIAVALRIGEPAHGYTELTVPLPTRIPRADPVRTENEGFTLICGGRGREASVGLAFDLSAVPPHLPEVLTCPVGPHALRIRLTNDLEPVPGAAERATFRLGTGMWVSPVAEGPDGPCTVLDAGDQPVTALDAWIRDGMLWARPSDGIVPGSYRCAIDGRPPIVLEVLPPEG